MIDEKSMTLATDWKGQFIGGWWFSEKLNGCRAYWDGAKFWTRHGNVIDAPRWFTKGLPKIHLDGEIHAGRGFGFGNDNSAYKVASNAVRLGGDWFNECDDCHPIIFTAFDAPQVAGNWLQRLAEIPESIRIAAEEVRTGEGRNLSALMQRVWNAGGEGGMFRNPECQQYETGRSKNLLRWKFTNEK